MTKLEDLTTGTRLIGLAANGVATVESAQWIGQQALKVIFRDGDGQLGEQLFYRDDEPSLELVEMGRPWSFDGDGDLLRLVSEVYRINLAWLFDRYVAITTSLIEPLLYQRLRWHLKEPTKASSDPTCSSSSDPTSTPWTRNTARPRWGGRRARDRTMSLNCCWIAEPIRRGAKRGRDRSPGRSGASTARSLDA